MTCDWGDCDRPAAGWRWWRRPPVCADHEPMELELAA